MGTEPWKVTNSDTEMGVAASCQWSALVHPNAGLSDLRVSLGQDGLYLPSGE